MRLFIIVRESNIQGPVLMFNKDRVGKDYDGFSCLEKPTVFREDAAQKFAKKHEKNLGNYRIAIVGPRIKRQLSDYGREQLQRAVTEQTLIGAKRRISKRSLIDLRIMSRWRKGPGYHEWSARLFVNRELIACMPAETHIGESGCREWALKQIKERFDLRAKANTLEELEYGDAKMWVNVDNQVDCSAYELFTWGKKP